MFALVTIAALLAGGATSTASCPVQPEPAALASASFTIPRSGETLLFSAAPSSQSIRYALRIVRPNSAKTATASLIRLQRRFDCNVHDRVGEWRFTLSREETEQLFAAAAALEQRGKDPNIITLDGTRADLKRYSDGKVAFTFSSNGPEKEELSKVVLSTVRHHVSAKELPAANDWRYKLPGQPL